MILLNGFFFEVKTKKTGKTKKRKGKTETNCSCVNKSAVGNPKVSQIKNVTWTENRVVPRANECSTDGYLVELQHFRLSVEISLAGFGGHAAASVGLAASKK